MAGKVLKLHKVHCQGCQECRNVPWITCMPSHDPLDQGICFKEGCENYMNKTSFPDGC